MRRYVILFAREPGREARAKGLSRPEAAGVFAGFARGWSDAARAAGGRLILATPPEDLRGWRGALQAAELLAWIPQTGRSFAQRLERVARQSLALGGHAVLVGGDVVPSPECLAEAFHRLDAGCDAVLCPADDGGVSLISVRRREDLDLVGRMPLRRRDVFSRLLQALEARGRRVAVISTMPDVDGRRGLRRVLRSSRSLGPLRSVFRRALARRPTRTRPRAKVGGLRPGDAAPVGLRAPPAA